MPKFFTTQDKKRIVAAITRAELKTSGEIRVHIETYCPSSSLERAVFVFNQLKMYKTKGRNSVLIYLATESRKFAVLGDTGINAVVPDGFWESVREIMRQSFVDGRFVDPIKRGSTVHEHTAKIAPDTEATAYASHRLAFDPRYFITDCLDMKFSIAPAIKNAGIRQNSTCSLAYS